MSSFRLAACVAATTAATVSGERTTPLKAVFALRHDPAALAQLERRLYEIADPDHADYGKWLSHKQVEEFVRVSPGIVAAAEDYVHKTCPRSLVVDTKVTGHGDYLEVTLKDHADSDACLDRLVASESWQTHARAAVEGAFPIRKPLSISTEASHVHHHEEDSQYPEFYIKKAYGIPKNETGAQAPNNIQLLWGPGTYGYDKDQILAQYANMHLPSSLIDKVQTYGYAKDDQTSGDNQGECTLDILSITAMTGGITTLVANTNTSHSTEETVGFGWALLSFSHLLANAQSSQDLKEKGATTADADDFPPLPLPTVLSMSLGSLSLDSCKFMCEQATKSGAFSYEKCENYLKNTRQVCMFPWDQQDLPTRVNSEFLKASSRGVTLAAATGDGGSHFSFQRFPDDEIGSALNEVSCANSMPTFPAESPYVLGVGGSQDAGPSPRYWYRGGTSFSRRFEMPSYQKDQVAAYLKNPVAQPLPKNTNTSMRFYPDVTAIADDGTSEACPLFTGVISLINSRRLAASLPPLGFLQPRLYKAAANNTNGYAQNMFTDITEGDSNVDCMYGFSAARGWDIVTGWGDPKWEGLSANLAKN